MQLTSTSSTRQYVPASAWGIKELEALVEFVLLHHDDKWPNTMQEQFWSSAAVFVRDRAGTPHLRTGNNVTGSQ